MRRRVVNFRWEDEDAQACFAEWCPFPDAKASAEDADRIEAFLHLAPPADVLDIGCGTGRHAVELSRRGYRVVGIDVAKRYLGQARAAARDAGVTVEFRLQRGSELFDEAVFDVALAYWHTIGFMADQEIRRHFAVICHALKPDGTLLYVFQGPKRIPRREAIEATPVRSWQERNGKFILTEKCLRDGYRDENCVVIDPVAGEIVEYREHQRALAYAEVLSYLQGAGFTTVEAYKDFDGRPASKMVPDTI